MNKDPREYEDYLTVGQLLDFIKKNNIPLEGKVFIERVKDFYFSEGGWQVVKKEDYHCAMMRKRNKDIEKGRYDDKEQFPDLDDPKKYIVPEDFIEESKSQYYPAWCAINFKEENHLFLSAFY